MIEECYVLNCTNLATTARVYHLIGGRPLLSAPTLLCDLHVSSPPAQGGNHKDITLEEFETLKVKEIKEAL